MHDPADVQREYRSMYACFLRELQEHVQRTQPRKIVIAGFGNGPELPVLTRAAPAARVVAVDNDETAIAGGWRRYGSDGSRNVLFLNADVRSELVQQEFKDAHLIVAFFILHLLGDSNRVSGKWFDLAPQPSYLALADWCAPDPCIIDERWTPLGENRYGFRTTNPNNPRTTSAALRIVEKA